MSDKKERTITLYPERWSKGAKKAFAYITIGIVCFGIGGALVAGVVLTNRNAPHKNLQSTANYCTSIISSFEANVFKSSNAITYYCEYTYNSYSNFTYGAIDGDVQYIDNYITHPEYEIMIISFDATGYYIEDILFHVNEDIRLSLIIFTDGQIYYTSNHLKKDIALDFDISVELIELYFF